MGSAKEKEGNSVTKQSSKKGKEKTAARGGCAFPEKKDGLNGTADQAVYDAGLTTPSDMSIFGLGAQLS